MSYVIRNCPCYTSKGGYYDCWASQDTWCENITDCVIKQVIEKCKTIIEKDYKEEDRHLFSEDDLKILDRTWLDVGMGCKKTARQILRLFDIEEIRE